MPDAADASRSPTERCVACRRDAPRVTDVEAAALATLIPDWKREKHDGVPRLVRTFRVPTFATRSRSPSASANLPRKRGITRLCSPSGER